MSSSLRHPPPFRATAPLPGRVWSVDVLDRGVVLSSHTLPHPIQTFGRDEDSVTIPLSDPSASRVHAAVAYDSSGRLNACDMSSANGSLLSGKKLPGGQWVVLQDGATLRFGTSGVCYTFMAPPGWEVEKSGVPQPPSQSMVLSGEAAEATLEGEAGEAGRPMGMIRLGGPAKPPSSSPWLEALALQQCTEKEREAIGRLQQKQQRLSHARTEASRIQAKEGGGLSDGQQAQLNKLEATIETLQDTLVEEESALRTRLEARRPGCTGLPPPATTTSGAAVGEREREVDPSWLRDSDDVVDKTRGGASLVAPKSRPVFSLRTGGGGGGGGSMGVGLKGVVAPPPSRQAPPPTTTSTATTTQAPLQTEASLTARIAFINQRLEDISQERGKWKAGKGEGGGGGEDSLATYVSALKESEGARIAKEEVELKGEKESLLSLLAIIQPSLLMQAPAVGNASVMNSSSSSSSGGVKHPRKEEVKEEEEEERKAVAPVVVRGEKERVEGGAGVSGSMASILEPPPPPAKKLRSAPPPQPTTTSQYDAEPEDLTRFT